MNTETFPSILHKWQNRGSMPPMIQNYTVDDAKV